MIKDLQTRKEGAEKTYESRGWTLKALVLVGPFFPDALVLHPLSRSEPYDCTTCAQPICAFISPRSICFCVIWDCICPSSGSSSRPGVVR